MRKPLVLSLACLLVMTACSDDDGGGNDSGVNPGNYELVILTPPGRSIGLAPSAQVALRVQYLDPLGTPVPNAEVSFAIQGNAGGATLAGFSAITAATGTAEMLLTAGAAMLRRRTAK